MRGFLTLAAIPKLGHCTDTNSPSPMFHGGVTWPQTPGWVAVVPTRPLSKSADLPLEAPRKVKCSASWGTIVPHRWCGLFRICTETALFLLRKVCASPRPSLYRILEHVSRGFRHGASAASATAAPLVAYMPSNGVPRSCCMEKFSNFLLQACAPPDCPWYFVVLAYFPHRRTRHLRGRSRTFTPARNMLRPRNSTCCRSSR